MTDIADKPFFTPSKQGGVDGKCGYCEMLERCRERVQIGLWILCEIPDEHDLAKARLTEYGNAALR